MRNEIDTVNTILYEAFPILSNTTDDDINELNNELTWEQIYLEIYSLSSQDLINLLPRMLSNLLKEDKKPDYGLRLESTLRYLNVLSYYPEDYYQDMAKYIGEDVEVECRNHGKKSRKIKQELYKDFTDIQGRAILSWLLHIQRRFLDWENSVIDEDDLLPAIDYWKTRTSS